MTQADLNKELLELVRESIESQRIITQGFDRIANALESLVERIEALEAREN